MIKEHTLSLWVSKDWLNGHDPRDPMHVWIRTNVEGMYGKDAKVQVKSMDVEGTPNGYEVKATIEVEVIAWPQ